MTSASVHDDLQGFALGARRAVVAAQGEARQLGHERVGTEHLLLGLLADPDVEPLLHDAGATIAVARRKVREAVPATGPVDRSAALPRSARCARAIGRAARFARDQRSDQVESVHLLLGVLDVEGTAGQVLRGLGVDIEQVRASVGAGPQQRHGPSTTGDDEAPGPSPRCPGCAADVTAGLTGTRVPVDGADGRPVLAVSCPSCGTVLGLIPD